MAKLTKFDLNWYAESDFRKKQAQQHLKFFRDQAYKSIFLSHSHKDKKLANGLANMLASMGIDLYIDWKDDDMPRITNRETADRIKEEIRKSDLIMMLATENAMNSKWVPWEIGVADSNFSENRIAIVPVEGDDGKYHGSEYLQLYRRLEYDPEDGLQLFMPQYEYVFDKFLEYLEKLDN